MGSQGVRLRGRADNRGGKRAVLIGGQDFIARFLQHALPSDFKRIRHYGLLIPAVKTQKLAAARSTRARTWDLLRFFERSAAALVVLANAHKQWPVKCRACEALA